MARQLTLFDLDTVRAANPKTGVSVADRMNDYDGFVEKFKPKKTTDDCYTPPAVYDAVVGWCRDEGLIADDTEIVRPFWPGADYTLCDYPEGCAVIDNPPFSIYAQVVRWFLDRGIRFLLFGPQLTLSIRRADVCFLPVNVSVTYENGAIVSTGFVTNMIDGVRLWTAPSLRRAVAAAAPPKALIPKNTYPDNFVNCALIGKVAAREVDFKLMSGECEDVSNLDGARAAGKSVFGGGWLISERAAAERAAAERAAGLQVELSERERTIVERLSERPRKEARNEMC